MSTTENDEIMTEIENIDTNDREEEQILENNDTHQEEEEKPLENQLNEEQPSDESSRQQEQFDVIVIGSGPGGYTSAIRCAQLGMKVALVERDLLGGHAINWGCIPFNAMLVSARLMRSIHESKRYGIEISSCRIEFSRIARHRDEAVRRARSQLKRILDKYHIETYTGHAEIRDPNHVFIQPIEKYNYTNVYDANGRNPYETDDYKSISDSIEISTKHIIIASGVKYELPQFVVSNDKQTLDPTQLLWYQTIPKSLIIIGGGVLGCEFASLYRYLGSNIVLIEKNSRLLKFLDEHVSNAVEKRLKEIGVEIILNATIERISKGEVEMELRHGNVKRKINAHVVVVCTGRKPTINYENFNKLGIEFNEDRSTIMIDEKTCCTSIKNIYACGGVVSSCWSWIPCVIRQGHLAASSICNQSDESNRIHQLNYKVTPFVVNVIPAVASVGEVPKQSDNTLVYTFEFQYNRRAIIDNQTWGFIKMWTTRDEPKRFLAVQLVHEAAAEIIEYYSMIISLDLSLHDVCLLPFAHPTYTESVKQACEYVLSRSQTYEGTYLN